MPSVGIDPTVSAYERPQTYALDRAATRTVNIQTYTSTKFSHPLKLKHGQQKVLLL